MTAQVAIVLLELPGSFQSRNKWGPGQFHLQAAMVQGRLACYNMVLYAFLNATWQIVRFWPIYWILLKLVPNDETSEDLKLFSFRNPIAWGYGWYLTIAFTSRRRLRVDRISLPDLLTYSLGDIHRLCTSTEISCYNPTFTHLLNTLQ